MLKLLKEFWVTSYKTDKLAFYLEVFSVAVTIAGSPGANEYTFFQISRDVSADDLTADARLLGIKLFYTTSAANDA